MNVQRLKSIAAATPLLKHLIVAVRAKLAKRTIDRLNQYLFQVTQEVDPALFVKVGANDGLTGDPCGDIFLTNPNWHGILIEPVPYCVERLQKVYSDSDRFVIEQVAVDTTSGSATFYYVSEEAKGLFSELPEWYDQLGSFDRNHILKHLDGKLERFIITAGVNVEPLGTVLRRNNVKRIDLLQVDTEGHDLQVLKSLDFTEYTPRAIFVEHKHLSPDDRHAMKTLLQQNGYTVLNARGDYFALHQSIDAS